MSGIINFITAREPAGEVVCHGAFWTIGTCPACGHRSEAGDGTPDRVRIRPDWKGGKGWWQCHRCGASGDGIDLLMQGYAVRTVGEARACIGLAPQGVGGGNHQSTTAPPSRTVAKTLQPQIASTIDMARWRHFVESFLDACHGEPSLPRSGRRAFEERGLPVGFDAWGTLAWNNHVRFVSGAELGVAGIEKVRIPRGMVIVCRRCGGMFPVSLSVRRDPYTEDVARYGRMWEFGHGVPSRPYISDGMPGLPLILTESYLDAIAIRYAVGDDVICAGLGGAGKRPDADLAEFLDAAPMCWFWYDADDAGLRAFQRIQAVWPKVLPLRLNEGCGKDATGMVKLGLEHPEWHVPSIGEWLTQAGVVGRIEEWAASTGMPRLLHGLVRVETPLPYLGGV